ncbi:MAG: sporulation initiation factor Spo0A C-terminal domain-containing protein [Clostridiaceae bacterium]|nr:sporulation initiation factor Spo0A C-terminal domain-containing protein [Clostridiaceae bacterium]
MKHEEIVAKILRHFEVTSVYQGYDYTIYAMELTIKDNECLKYVTKMLYPEIARKYKTSWSCVERNIRTVVEIVWRNGGNKFFYEVTGEYIEKRPRNAKFLELMMICVLCFENSDPEMFEDRCRNCPIVKAMESDTEKLEKRNKELSSKIKWMHDLIWDLMNKARKEEVED